MKTTRVGYFAALLVLLTGAFAPVFAQLGPSPVTSDGKQIMVGGQTMDQGLTTTNRVEGGELGIGTNSLTAGDTGPEYNGAPIGGGTGDDLGNHTATTTLDAGTNTVIAGRYRVGTNVISVAGGAITLNGSAPAAAFVGTADTTLAMGTNNITMSDTNVIVFARGQFIGSTWNDGMGEYNYSLTIAPDWGIATPMISLPGVNQTQIFDVSQQLMYDSVGTASARFNERQLYASGGDTVTLDWNARTLSGNWSAGTNTLTAATYLVGTNVISVAGGAITLNGSAPAGDNLGNHTATTTLALGTNNITLSDPGAFLPDLKVQFGDGGSFTEPGLYSAGDVRIQADASAGLLNLGGQSVIINTGTGNKPFFFQSGGFLLSDDGAADEVGEMAFDGSTSFIVDLRGTTDYGMKISMYDSPNMFTFHDYGLVGDFRLGYRETFRGTNSVAGTPKTVVWADSIKTIMSLAEGWSLPPVVTANLAEDVGELAQVYITETTTNGFSYVIRTSAGAATNEWKINWSAGIEVQ